VGQQLATKEEEPRRTKVFREWKGVNTQSSRNTLPEGAWWNLENMQPIGDGNIRTCNNISAALVNYGSDIIYWFQYVNVGGTDYLILFATDGKVFAYNIVAQTSAQIATGFSGSGSRVVQWKNTQALFIDATGYYNWPGTGSPTLISGTGVPTSGTDIAVAFGRVWIVQGRLITFSGADDYSAASFTVANGAGSLSLTDPTIRSTVTRLYSQNSYLYIVSATAINAISDVYVPSGASPPTPLFTNTNIQAIIGSNQPGSFFPLGRGFCFANNYGAWSLYGVQAEQISKDIDGTWKYINTSLGISAGAAVSNNKICGGFLVQRQNDPNFGSNTVVAMYFDQKWWFANYGALTFIGQGVVSNQPALFGLIANNLYQLFADPTTAPATVLSTALWPMEDNLADKQVLRVGFEVQVSIFQGTFNLTVDTVNNQSEAIALAAGGSVTWQNNGGNLVSWQNNSLVTVLWNSSSYLLYNSISPGVYGKYVGMTISSTGAQYQFSATDMDYKLRARWL
jgi:hypothetical protein